MSEVEFPIPYAKHSYSQADKEALLAALDAPFWTQGPLVQKFEEEMAAYVHAPFAVAVSNGTTALHLAVVALEKKFSAIRSKKGKTVLTTAITFAASSNCALYAGLDVEFVDINPQTLCIDMDQCLARIEKNPDQYVGVVPVGLAGYPVDLKKLFEICEKNQIWVLEDACHAVGAYDGDVYSASCKYSHASILSFHPAKHIATGEGGMLFLRDKELKDSAALLRTHGITKNFPTKPGYYMEMQELGFNYRMPDLLCALGLSQLKQMEAGVKRRHEIAKIYKDAFSDLAAVQLTQQQLKPSQRHAYHLYVAQVQDRDGLFEYLKTKQVYCQLHYIPVYRHPYYQKIGNYKPADYPHAEHYYKTAISLPMYAGLTHAQQEYVISEIKNYYGKK